MRVLVATKQTQGRRKNDFSWAEEGEIVGFGGIECDHRIDGSCGCKRSLCGLTTRKATTTMLVVEQQLTVDELAGLIALSHSKAFPGCGDPEEQAQEEAQELARLAAGFPVGTVVERRGQKFQERPIPGHNNFITGVR